MCEVRLMLIDNNVFFYFNIKFVKRQSVSALLVRLKEGWWGVNILLNWQRIKYEVPNLLFASAHATKFETEWIL